MAQYFGRSINHHLRSGPRSSRSSTCHILLEPRVSFVGPDGRRSPMGFPPLLVAGEGLTCLTTVVFKMEVACCHPRSPLGVGEFHFLQQFQNRNPPLGCRSSPLQRKRSPSLWYGDIPSVALSVVHEPVLGLKYLGWSNCSTSCRMGASIP